MVLSQSRYSFCIMYCPLANAVVIRGVNFLMTIKTQASVSQYVLIQD